MLGKIIGAVVGNRIDRSDGKGGVKGAVLGAATAGLLRRTGPLGLAALGGVYVAKKLYDRKKAKRDGSIG